VVDRQIIRLSAFKDAIEEVNQKGIVDSPRANALTDNTLIGWELRR
jgi:hypothetical protein